MNNVKIQDLKDYMISMPIYDSSADEPDYYSGAKEVCKALKLFCDEKEKAQKADFNLGEEPWADTNTFQVLTADGEFYAIRNYGRYKPVSTDFLFKTPFIPLLADIPYDKRDLMLFASKATTLLKEEVKNMVSKAGERKPLFLTYYMKENRYAAWSILEEKTVNVYGYKSYNDDFRVTYGIHGQVSRLYPGNEFYILPPSEELVILLGLNLNSDIWEQTMPWDKSIKKEERIPIDINIPYDSESITEQQQRLMDIKQLYYDAVRLANMGRRTYFAGTENAFTELEKRLDNFERLYNAGAPIYPLKYGIDKVKNAFDDVNKMINKLK